MIGIAVDHKHWCQAKDDVMISNDSVATRCCSKCMIEKPVTAFPTQDHKHWCQACEEAYYKLVKFSDADIQHYSDIGI